MPSQRQIHVGRVPIGGGAPVAVQTMTKTETADLQATMDQIARVAEAGADIVRVAVPRDKDVEALKTIVAQSPIPIIADIHFNHTLAIKALEAGAHCVRLNPGNIGGPEKVAEVTAVAKRLGTPLRVGVNSGSLPAHLRQLEYDNPVEALVTAAVETVELMERLQFDNFKVSMKSTSVPNTIASNRLLAERIPYPLHLGVTEAGTKWSGSLKSAVGLGTLLADGIGDTIRISLSTFHAEEEVKVAWEILKALKLRERGPVLIACPTCGRLQFDMDTVVVEVERRLEQYADPIEVSVLGCAVNGIGEARHADFGITGAKDMGMIYSKGEPLKKVRTEELVDELFKEIDRYYEAGKVVRVDERQAAEAREWLAANEDETAMTPERLAAMEKAAALAHDDLDPAGAAGDVKPVAARRGSVAGRRVAGSPAPERRSAVSSVVVALLGEQLTRRLQGARARAVSAPPGPSTGDRRPRPRRRRRRRRGPSWRSSSSGRPPRVLPITGTPSASASIAAYGQASSQRDGTRTERGAAAQLRHPLRVHAPDEPHIGAGRRASSAAPHRAVTGDHERHRRRRGRLRSLCRTPSRARAARWPARIRRRRRASAPRRSRRG